ncbi:MAG: SDR family oxidoreductase [Chloroflexi bacterium]|nr:MAG: SDR family oxidoreductase [Chloroflexota bacterium]
MPILDKFNLTGRVALVTGGNRGLGQQMALALAEAGADVALTSRDQDRADEAAAQIAQATGRTVLGYACDVSSSDETTNVVRQVIAELGGLHIVVNNAGINIRGPIDELTPEDFRKVLDTNVVGVWNICRAAAGHLKGQKYGRVINIGSTLSVIALADRTPYTSSKGAVLQMSRALALEWAPYGITVNTMLPGPFATEMNTPLKEDPVKYQEFIAKIPLGRWGNLDEIGGLAVFLASDAASFVTGAGVTIDGGWTVH